MKGLMCSGIRIFIFVSGCNFDLYGDFEMGMTAVIGVDAMAAYAGQIEFDGRPLLDDCVPAATMGVIEIQKGQVHAAVDLSCFCESRFYSSASMIPLNNC